MPAPTYRPHEVTPALAERLTAMPKAEIHVHLEGATDAATVWELAQRNRVRLPAASLAEWQQRYDFTDFAHFVDVYVAATRTMLTLDDWVFLVERFLGNQARQNIVYTEAFLSTSLHLDKFPADEWLDALGRGAAAGLAHYGTRVAFIPDISREFPATSQRVLEFVLGARSSGLIVGMGVGGPEVGFPPELFIDVFSEARRQGVHVVAHAGETDGPSSVWGALTALGAERIGHGIHCLTDPALVTELRVRGTPLEVSPTSNYCTGQVAPDQPHPIHRMLQAGLICTLNSDDPPMFNTDLVGEYHLLAAQGMPWATLWHLNCATLEASFLPEAAKQVLRQQWAVFAQAHPV